MHFGCYACALVWLYTSDLDKSVQHTSNLNILCRALSLCIYIADIKFSENHSKETINWIQYSAHRYLQLCISMSLLVLLHFVLQFLLTLCLDFFRKEQYSPSTKELPLAISGPLSPDFLTRKHNTPTKLGIGKIEEKKMKTRSIQRTQTLPRLWLLTLRCDFELLSMSRKLMTLHVAYCIQSIRNT